MVGRLLITLLAAAVIAGPASGLVQNKDDVALRREEDITELVTLTGDDDDGDDSNDGDTSGDRSGDSNDGTGSGHTSVSRDRDRSRGDKTRDRTRDGKGGVKRDWSGGHTNDRSRNDTR